MSRLVPAARQLTSEITAIAPKAKVEVLDEYDGLGFQRSIRISTEVAKTLGDDVVEALGSDARIAEVVRSSKGVRFTFVPDTRADGRTSFGVAEAMSVSGQD